MKDIVPVERIENRIFVIRGLKVMLDSDLAELYQIEPKQLKRQVHRNLDRFPSDFMITLTKAEYELLRCQIGTLKRGQHSKYLPYAFTEQGVAMLSSVLNSKRAIEINILIMRAFVKLRQMMATHKELAQKFEELEGRVGTHDAVINKILEAIRELMTPVKTEVIGFQV